MEPQKLGLGVDSEVIRRASLVPKDSYCLERSIVQNKFFILLADTMLLKGVSLGLLEKDLGM